MRFSMIALPMLFLSFPRIAMACATCFGAPDSPQTQAANMAIFFMLCVAGTVLGAVGTLFAHLIRREKKTAAIEVDPHE